jgi:hypothetical protein
LFQPPEDLLADLRDVLSRAGSVITGRNHQRLWRIGNIEIDELQRTMSGQIGWERISEALASAWDESLQRWVEDVVVRNESAVSPFAFIEAGHYLGVLKHPSFTTERMVPFVLRRLLNVGELSKDLPVTDWDVEPVGNREEFIAWLDSVDQLEELSLVFRRPNPDGEADFQWLSERLDRLQASSISETLRARDAGVGLDKAAIKADATTNSFISAAMAAFGYVRGKGKKNGKATKYDQRQHVMRTRVESVGSDWDGATARVLGAVRDVVKSRESADGELEA